MMVISENNFVAVRMIVLHPEVTPQEFTDFMFDEFIPGMTTCFADQGLLSFALLKGNKVGRQSREGAGADRTKSTPAGANSDFAWISCWADIDANRKAWKTGDRTLGWDDLWMIFLSKCHPRSTIKDGDPDAVDAWCPNRPMHGPPFDFRGAPGYSFFDPIDGKVITHYGRGVGCLTEGFKVIKVWPPDEEAGEGT